MIKRRFGAGFVLLLLGMTLSCYAVTYTFESPFFSGPIECPTIDESNMASAEECGKAGSEGPWIIGAYNVGEFFQGVSLTMTSMHANGTVPILQRNPLIVEPGGVIAPDQEIPLEVEWEPCHNPEVGGTSPTYLSMSVAQSRSVGFEYGNEYACADAVDGIPGKLKVTRKALTTLPEEGNYQGSLTFTVGPE